MSRIEKVRVLIAEDQTLIREGIATLLAQQNDDFEILPGAADGEQAIEFARRYRPDVILMDLQMPRVDGIAATQRILRELPQTHIVVLTTFETNDLIFEAVSAGAKAYLLKDASRQEVIDGLRERGLLHSAWCVRHHPVVTFGLRLARDLSERRKPPLTLLRRGLVLLRAEPSVVASHVAKGARAASPRRVEQLLTTAAGRHRSELP